jgi:hypothetical protein
MVVLKKTVNVSLAAVLIFFTAVVKVMYAVLSSLKWMLTENFVDLV